MFKHQLYSLSIIYLCLILIGCTGNPPRLGLTEGQFSPCPEKPNCVSSQAEDSAQRVKPISLQADPKEAVRLILKALAKLDARNVQVQNDYIRAEFVSTIFRFVDDVEIYLVEKTEPNDNVTIHIRSASRTGYSDFGVNRERVEEFSAILMQN